MAPGAGVDVRRFETLLDEASAAEYRDAALSRV